MFSGDHKILQTITSFILSKGWELDGYPVHIGNNVYEIPFTKEVPQPLAGTGYLGKFWLEGEDIKYKHKMTWMS
jgi:hypothetical protein